MQYQSRNIICYIYINQSISIIIFMKIFILIAILFISSTSTEWYEQGDPVFMHDDNSDTLLKQPRKYKFLKFFTPWCIYCKWLKPTVDVLVKELSYRKDIIFYEINCHTSQNLCMRLGAYSFPFLVMTDDNGNPRERMVGMQPPNIVRDFILRNSNPQFSDQQKKQQATPQNIQLKVQEQVKIEQPSIPNKQQVRNQLKKQQNSTEIKQVENAQQIKKQQNIKNEAPEIKKQQTKNNQVTQIKKQQNKNNEAPEIKKQQSKNNQVPEIKKQQSKNNQVPEIKKQQSVKNEVPIVVQKKKLQLPLIESKIQNPVIQLKKQSIINAEKPKVQESLKQNKKQQKITQPIRVTVRSTIPILEQKSLKQQTKKQQIKEQIIDLKNPSPHPKKIVELSFFDNKNSEYIKIGVYVGIGIIFGYILRGIINKQSLQQDRII